MMSKSTAIIGLLFHMSNTFLRYFVYISLFLLLIITIFQSAKKNSKLKPYIISGFLLFLIILIIDYVYNFRTDFRMNGQFKPLITSYLVVLLVYVLMSVDIKKFWFDKRVCYLIIITFSFFNALLGVIQYLFENPIVPIAGVNGNPVVNPVFYLNGVSSNKIAYLYLGAKVRAFGVTDSGLTLGLLCLLTIAILFSSKSIKNFIKVPLIIFFCVAIYMTITRIIYVALIMLVVFLIFKKRKNLLRFFLYFCGLIQILAIIFAYGILNFLPSSIGNTSLATLSSRFEGYLYYFNVYEFSIERFLIGFNNVSLRTQQNAIYSLDNEMLNVFFDVGFLGLLLVLLIYIHGYNAILKTDDYTMCVILSLFMLLGITNSVYYFFFPVLIIAILTQSTKKVIF